MKNLATQEKTIDGVPIKELAGCYGSPLFIVSEKTIDEIVDETKKALADYYPNSRIFYSVKTNYLPGILSIMKNRGVFAEVVSGFEYWLARKVGYKGNEIIFNGPDKQVEEINAVLDGGSLIYVDNHYELERIGKIASERKIPCSIGIRISLTPPKSLKQISDIFDKFPNKGWWRFGFSIDNDEAYRAVELIIRSFNYVNLASLHLHLGTHIRSPEYYYYASRKLFSFINRIEKDFKVNISQVDLGGGYYKTPIREYIHRFASVFNPFSDRVRLVIEPGTYLINDAVQLVTSVINTRMRGTTQETTIKASTSLLFPGLFSSLKLDTAERLESNVIKYKTNIFGNSCVSSDILSEEIMLPEMKNGDIVVFPNVGAYTISKSEQFIFPRPAVILIRKNGEIMPLRRQETYEDLIMLDEF